MIVWMLQHRLLIQLHTYVYFMPTEKGLSYPQQARISIYVFTLYIIPFLFLFFSMTGEKN